jgi:hypothetical protein
LFLQLKTLADFMIAARSISPLFLKFRILADSLLCCDSSLSIVLRLKILAETHRQDQLSPLFLQLKNIDRFPAAAIDPFHYSSAQNPCQFTSARIAFSFTPSARKSLPIRSCCNKSCPLFFGSKNLADSQLLQ